MGKTITFAAALAAMSTNVNAIGSFSECLTQEDVTLTDISNVDYSMSWEMALDPGDSCWYLTFNTAYANWPEGTDVSVKYQTYRLPFGETEETCQPNHGSERTYQPLTLVHTDQTPWPYTEPSICAHLFVFTNDSPDFESTLEFYTNGGVQAFGATVFAAITALMLF